MQRKHSTNLVKTTAGYSNKQPYVLKLSPPLLFVGSLARAYWLERRVFDGHIDQIALRVQINVEIFVDLASFHHSLIGKLYLCRVGVFEVFNFHAANT